MSYRNPVRAVGVSGGTVGVSGGSVSISGGTVGVSSVGGVVDVSGSTVKTEGAGGSTAPPAPAVRSSASDGRGTQTGSASVSITTPSNVQADDLLVFFLTSRADQGVQPPAGVTQQGKQLPVSDQTQPATWVFTRVAVTSDASRTFTFSGLYTDQAAQLAVIVLSGAAGVTAAGTAQAYNGSPATIYTPKIGQNTMLLGVVFPRYFNGQVPAGNFGWGNTAEGGPPSPPAWSDFAGNGGFASRYGVTVSNWTTAASYAAKLGGVSPLNNAEQFVSLWRVTQ